MGLLACQSYAVIGDTPYTLAQNLDCPDHSAYVTGTTKLDSSHSQVIVDTKPAKFEIYRTILQLLI